MPSTRNRGEGATSAASTSTTPASASRLPPLQDNFIKFLWNPEAKEVLGRTWQSWGKIGLFYVVFYSFLAAFFSVMMAVFYATIDKEVPKYTGEETLLRNPGLSFRPYTSLKDLRPHIVYDPKDNDTSDAYVSSISTLLKEYSQDAPRPANALYQNCSWDDLSDGNNSTEEDRVCTFDLAAINSSCSLDDRWGYNSYSPCVFLKLNKIFHWVPEGIDDIQKLPVGLQQHINDSHAPNALLQNVWVWCESKGVMLEQPSPGVPIYYFPYHNQAGYLSPLVPVRFLNLPAGKEVKVQCRLWAKDVPFKVNRRLTGQADIKVTVK